MQTHGKMETEYGRISINKDVISAYAGTVALESFGIVGMAAVNMKDGIVRLLKKDHLSHGIETHIDKENGIYLKFHVIASYGVSITSVVDNLRETVKYKLEAFTGMKVKQIDVEIEGVRVID